MTVAELIVALLNTPKDATVQIVVIESEEEIDSQIDRLDVFIAPDLTVHVRIMGKPEGWV